MGGKGTPLWKALLFERRVPWRYHAFFNDYFFNPALLFYLTCKGYKQLPIGKGIMNSGSHIFLKGNAVVKYPKRGSPTYALAKDKGKFKSYQSTLLSLPDIPFLHNHINALISLTKKGVYVSPYVKGINLQSIKEGHFDPVLTPKLKKAILAFLQVVDAYQKKYKKEYILGDWKIYNVIYSFADDKLVNIDLEGFYLYQGAGHSQNDVATLKKDFNELLSLLP